MQDILNLNKEFANYLEKSTAQMISDLNDILFDKSVTYRLNYSKASIVTYYFEYEWDILDIAFWAVNKSGEVINEILILPTKKDSKIDATGKWNSFLPEKIAKFIYDFENNYEGADIDEVLEKYEEEKHILFENWFCNCWTQTIKETDIKVNAYFSIHDTNYKTNLNNLERRPHL
ncbi:hypothetical protein ACFSX9_09735 [Flavobacterium ardleyense]|uniref:DUF4304 domain-containing protein n=1 Tax=Flavobacterium ardleyense TaxID=2038737 RepID=A0ABW5ZA80_9FLAO